MFPYSFCLYSYATLNNTVQGQRFPGYSSGWMVPVHLSHTRLNQVSVFGHYALYCTECMVTLQISSPHQWYTKFYAFYLVYCVVFYVEMILACIIGPGLTQHLQTSHLSTGTVHSWRAGDIKEYPKYNSMHTNETWSLGTVFTSIVYKQHSTVNHCTQKIACTYSTSSFLGDCTVHSHRLSYNSQANKTNTHFISKVT